MTNFRTTNVAFARGDDRLAIASSNSSPWLQWMAWIGVLIVWTTAFYFIEHKWDFSLALELEATEAAEETQLDELVESGSLQRRLAFPVVGLSGILLVLLGTGGARPRLSVNLGIFLAFALWTLASILWTQDVSLTVRRLIVFICVVAAAVGFRQQFGDKRCLYFVMGVVGVHLIIGIVAEIACGRLSAIGPDYRFAGTIHPNTQAIQLSAAGLASLCLLAQSRRKWIWVAVYAVFFSFVVATRSRTGLGSFLLASAVVAIPLIPDRLRTLSFLLPTAVLSIAAATVMVLDLPIAAKLESIIFLGRVEETGTLTGRTDIWQALLWYFRQRPLLGYGYGAFWTPAVLVDLGNVLDFQPSHAHNAYLQTMLDVGVIGTALLLTAAAVSFARALTVTILESDNIHARFFLGLFTLGAAFSILDTTFVIPGFINVITFAGLTMAYGKAATDTYGRWEREQSNPAEVTGDCFREVRR